MMSRSQGFGRLVRTVEVFALGSVVPLIVPTFVAYAGATGDSNISAKQAGGILAAALVATTNASSVSVSGNITSGKQTHQISLSFSASAAEGSISDGGHEIELLRIGPKIYQMAGQASLEAMGVSRSDAALLANRWLKIPASDKSDYSDLSNFLNLKQFMTQLTPGSGTMTSSTRSTLHGLPVYVISGTFKGAKGIFYVAAKGTPYIIRAVEPSGSYPGTLSFSSYGKPVIVQAPQNVIPG